jgi:hypothetical protein
LLTCVKFHGKKIDNNILTGTLQILENMVVETFIDILFKKLEIYYWWSSSE